MVDATEKKEEKSPRAGALKSSLSIELHSRYAIHLWEGRRAEKTTEGQRKRPEIVSMPRVIQRAGMISRDASADNPYADALLIALENALANASATIHALATETDTALASLPASVTLSDVVSVDPLNIGVFSRSPLGYRCVWLLVGYDQLAMKTFQALHYGLISRQRKDQILDNGRHAVRKVYGVVQNHRFVAVTRQDILNKTPAGQQAIALLGEPDPAIMDGSLRSAFSPPLRSVPATSDPQPIAKGPLR